MGKESSIVNPYIKIGRPSIKVDIAIVLRLREVEHLGWTLIAKRYQELTGLLISRDTVER